MNVYELMAYIQEQINLVKARPYINTERIERASEMMNGVRMNLMFHTNNPKELELVEAYKQARKDINDLKRATGIYGWKVRG